MGCSEKGSPCALNEEQLRKLFQQLDLNGDKYLSKEELKQAFNKVGAAFPGYRARRALKNVDTSGDGYVDMDEFDNLIDYVLKKGYTLT
ncbi:hypothetical protein JCGZ_04284 [Jatropha curcas]|uniref:EF-hand domain-containing protein n=1 Tax=Jatropha curcas TaxID=180498 RepID=A0A067L2N0_JATCU|nr:hypothetical protein JCGZ_04284 [Jatropha curcas]